MERRDIEALRARASCAVGLVQAGFEIDLKESTLRAVKYRRGAEMIIVTHEGRGWFDPLSDRKGDVFPLVGWLRRRDDDIAERWSARPVLVAVLRPMTI